MKLTDNERAVLAVLADDNHLYFSFDGIGECLSMDHEITLTRKEIRRACRSLARKGLAEYSRGLWNDDGVPAGSGYGATKMGRSRGDEAQ